MGAFTKRVRGTVQGVIDPDSMQEGETMPGVVTGKPPVVGGSEGRGEAPGRSVALTTREAWRNHGNSLEQTAVAVQGFGSVGANAVRLLDDWGATIVAISDVNGAAYDPGGIPVHEIPSYDEEPEAVTEYVNRHTENVITNVAAQYLRREVTRRLRIEVVSAVPCQEQHGISLELIWPSRDEVSVGDLSSCLDKELAERLPEDGVRAGMLFDGLAVEVMGKFTSDFAQPFESVIQCVRTVVGLVDDSPLMRGKSTVDGASMDIGAS